MSDDSAVTVTIRRRVKAGREAPFEEALREFIPQSLQFPGHMGVQVLRPASGAAPEWVVVVRFRSRRDYDESRALPEFRRWSARILDLLESDPVVEEQCGLEGWFRLPGVVAEPVLPRWKMAIVTWLGVNVAVIPLTWLLGPLVGSWPLIPQALFVNALIVGLLTWVIMPLLTRLLRQWLYSPGSEVLVASTKEDRS
jgi:antibiotic biosynthesis monooxygenase (ABM) superfamily enzyme